MWKCSNTSYKQRNEINPRSQKYFLKGILIYFSLFLKYEENFLVLVDFYFLLNNTCCSLPEEQQDRHNGMNPRLGIQRLRWESGLSELETHAWWRKPYSSLVTESHTPGSPFFHTLFPWPEVKSYLSVKFGRCWIHLTQHLPPSSLWIYHSAHTLSVSPQGGWPVFVQQWHCPWLGKSI